MADTYAIVESGGKQYRAEEGASLLVDRLPGEEGEKVNLRAVMFRADKVVLEPKELEKVKVEAVVTEQLRGPKVRVFKYRPKKGYRRRAGHRSELTKLEVKSVRMLSRRPAQKKQTAGSRQQAEAKDEAPAKKKRAAGSRQQAEAKDEAPAKKPAPSKKDEDKS